MQQRHDLLIQLGARGIALLGACDVTDVNFHSGRGRPEVDGWGRRYRVHALAMGGALPFFFGHARVGFRGRGNQLLNGIEDGIRTLRGRHQDLQLVPQPLPAGGKIEEVPFDGEAVDEGDLASRGMPGVIPVTSLQQHGPQQADFSDFTHHALDFHPIAHADSVPAHQREPPKEGDDEVLHRNCQASSGEAENGGHLAWHSEQHEQDEQDAHCLHNKTHHCAQSAQPPAIRNEMSEESIYGAIRPIHSHYHQQNKQSRLDDSMDGCTLAELHHSHPVGIDVGQILMVLDTLVQVRTAGRSRLCLRLAQVGLLRGGLFRRVVLLLELFAFLQSLFARLLQLHGFRTLRAPRVDLCDEVVGWRSCLCFRCAQLRTSGLALFLCRPVARKLSLDSAQRIGS